MAQFFNYLNNLPNCLIYILLGFSAFMENLIPPFPGDTVTAFGAFLVASGRLSLIGVFISTTLGSLLGFLGLFLAGRYLGRRFFLRRDFWFFKRSHIRKAEEWFRKYGYFLVLINRFLPGIRSVISVAGGISGLKIPKVICLALISAAIWNFIWILMGYILGSNWDMVKASISAIFARYNLAIFLLFMALVLFLIIRKNFWRKK